MESNNSSLVSVLTKTFADIFEQADKRIAEQKSTQDTHKKLLEELQEKLTTFETKITTLETKCQELNDENTNLKAELKLSKEKENEIAKEIVQVKSSLDKQQNRMKKYEGWINLITTIASQINSLNEIRDSHEERLREMNDNVADLVKQQDGIIRQQQQFATALATSATSSSTSSSNYRATTVKSPSASSFLHNGYMTHNSLPRFPKALSFQKNKSSYIGSVDAEEHMSELDDQFASLNRGVEELNDLQRSFENSSIYSSGD